MDFGSFDKPAFGKNPAMAGQAPASQAQAPQKKKRNFWLDQLSTATGIAGGIGGTMIAPVVGTAAGGAIGSGLGEAIENLIDPETGDWGNVAQETALGGVFAGGPFRLAKAGKEALAAKNAGMGTVAAIKEGGQQAKDFTLRGAMGAKATQKATDYSTKQFGLTGKDVADITGRYKEDPGKTIMRYGFTNVDEIGDQISKQMNVFDNLIESASPVKKVTLQKNLDMAADDLVKQMPRDKQVMGQKMIDEVVNLTDNLGDEISPKELNLIRKQYDDLVKYTNQMADPEKYTVNKRVADVLRSTLQDGSPQLKETGNEVSKLIKLKEVAEKRVRTVEGRGRSPFSLGNITGGVMGASVGAGAGVLGGGVGALAGMGAIAAANSPTGRRALTKGFTGMGERLSASGAKAAPKANSNLNTGLRVGVPGVLMGSSGSPTETASAEGQPDMSNMSLEDMLMMSATGDVTENEKTDPFAQQTGGFGQAQNSGFGEQVQSPYSKENLIYDMQRDPQNAKDYIAYYSALDEIFNKVPEGQKPLNSTAAGTIADTETGLKSLDELSQAIGTSSANNPGIGFLRSKNPFDTNAQNLQASIATSKQIVGKALEGGVLRKEDEYKYAKILPTLNDTDAVAQHKIRALKNLIGQRLAEYKSGIGTGSGGVDSLEDALMVQQGAY